MTGFQASQTANDQPAGFTYTQDYYVAVIKEAFPAFVAQGAIKPSKSDAGEFETALKAIWGSQEKPDNFLIGYIPHDNRAAKNYRSILQQIAEKEREYYYQWLDNSVTAKDEAKQEILTQLRRVSVLTYDRIFWGHVSGEGAQLEKLKNNLKADQNPNQYTFLPIAISWDAYFTANNQAYFGVYFNTDAKPLFVDTEQATRDYQYQKTANAKAYSKKDTFKYNYTEYEKLKNLIHNDDFAIYDYGKDKRYLVALRHFINQLANKGQAERSTKKVYDKEVNEAWLLAKINKGSPEENKNNSQKAEEFAQDSAQIIPTGYQCFYYDNGGALASFLSSVNIGEGRGSAAGYNMRADKNKEVNYQWSIALQEDDPNQPFAQLLSYLMELDRQYDNLQPPTAGQFFPTNWPYSKDFKTTTTGDTDSWFHYYKAFKDKDAVKRRNKPLTSPHITRITNPKFRGGDSSTANIKNTIKLDNASYRIWKKDVALGTASGARLNAGSVMAEALNGFQFYKNILGDKATYNKLPATSFAKYLLGNDTVAQNQWNADNSTKTAQVIADQEWCHLLGHGDGGEEELGNFVAGSKHCNTEQLAIETGQRRITHNKDIPQAVKDNITAKITAYLMPNEGAWVQGTITQQQYDSLISDITDKNALAAVKTQREAFFDPPSSQGGNYAVKSAGGLRKAFDALTDKIKATKGETKKALLALRGRIEHGYFLYQPLARWIRYKIYYNNNKIFDHLFDGQSQSLNVHECQILDFTVERVLYQALSKKVTLPIKKDDGTSTRVDAYTYYQTQVINRAQLLLPLEQGGKLVKEALDVFKEVQRIAQNLKTQPNDTVLQTCLKTFDDQRSAWEAIKKEFDKLSSAEQQASSLKKILPDFLNSLEYLKEKYFKDVEILSNNLNSAAKDLQETVPMEVDNMKKRSREADTIQNARKVKPRK